MNYKFLLFWILFQISVFIGGFFLQKENKSLSLLNQLGFSVYTSRGAGLCLAITPLLLILPMCRHTLTAVRHFIPVTNKVIPDFSVNFHKICAYTILFWSVIHMVCHFINFYGVETNLKISNMYNLHYTIFAGISGHIMIISLFSIFLFSGIYFRTFYYELFWYSHHFFILFFISIPFHGIGCFVKTDENVCLPYYSGLITSFGIIIYIIERVIREFRPLIDIQSVKYYGDDVFKISFSRNNIKYKPGQYLLIRCKDIDNTQWHSFTISSSPEDDEIELTIRCLGDWTRKFRNHLLTCENIYPKIQVDGAFGSPIDTICNYNAVILVASGIGITPYISMLKYIIQNKLTINCLKKIDIIWVNRDLNYFDWFNNELSYIEKHSSSLVLNFHMYLTENITDINRLKAITSQNIHYLNHIHKTNIPINYGRPNFDMFFNNYLKSNNDLIVGCFVCSSKSVNVNVKKSCEKYSNKDVNIVFKSEKF